MSDYDLNILVKAKGALQAARDIGKVDSSVGRLSRTASQGVRTAARNTAVIGAGIAVAIGAGVKAGIQSLADLEDATTTVQGAIVNAGIAGQVTAGQVATWANKIESDIGAAFDDKDILSATGTLIRFGKVTPGNLQPAMQVMTDLAVKTGSVDSAAALLAKAMAAPEKAAGKLSKAGVILTKEQQKQIKAMVKAGDVAGAQNIILAELTKTTKGAAEASQGPYRRSLSVLADVTEDAQRALGEGFLPVIEKVSSLLSKELAKPATINNIREFGKGLASGLDNLIDIARNLPWATIGDSLKIAGAGAKTILGAFSSLPPWVQTAVLTSWGLNKLSGGALGGIVGELGKGLIKGVLGMNAGVVNIKAGVVTGAGGVPIAGAPGGATSKLGALGNLLKVAVVGAVVVEGLSLWMQSMGGFIEENNSNAAKGLTKAETTALRYYKASASDQAFMAKKIGMIPSRADYESALAKLAAALMPKVPITANDREDRNRPVVLSGPDLAAANARQAKTDALLNDVGFKAQRAGERTAAAVSAIKPPVFQAETTVTVNVTAASIGKTVTVANRMGKQNGSYGGGRGYRSGALVY